MFDNKIFNLHVGYNMRVMPDKSLAEVEKENNYLYIQSCLERRHSFTTMVYSADRIPKAEALAA